MKYKERPVPGYGMEGMGTGPIDYSRHTPIGLRDYSDIGMMKSTGVGVGDIASSNTLKGAATGSPIAAGIGVAADVVGTGFDIYQGMQQADLAEKEYELALKQYNDEKKRAAEIDAYNKEQQRLSNTMAFGGYANELRQQDAKTGDFYSSIGR